MRAMRLHRHGQSWLSPAPTALLLTTVLLAGCSGASKPESEPPATSGPPASPEAATSSPAVSSPEESSPAQTLSQGQLDTRLIDAAWEGDVARARRLIETGADVNHRDETVQSAYLISTSDGPLRLLNLVLRHGADVRSLDSFNGTGLIRAADRGHADIVGRLLQTDIDVNHVNNLGWTALHEAILLGDGSQRYVDTVRLLVAGRADLRIAPVEDGIPPLQHAQREGHDAIAETLATALRAPKMAQPDRSLLRAATRGDADRAAVAIRQGADLETRDGAGRTPLLLAARYDRVAVARLLVALGADPNALDDQHDTPWLVTGVTGNVQMAEALLPARPDFSIVNRYGGTSLIPASERGHVAYVQRVVRTDLDINHVNRLGWTALLEAVILGDGSRPYQRIVKTLLEAGADPGIADRDGVTALQHARNSGQTAVARLLSDPDGQ